MPNHTIKKLLISLSLGFAVFSANAATDMNGFDFSYSVELDKIIGVIQVFDDGDRTYFQLNQFDKLPTVYVEQGGKKILAKLEIKPPYLIAEGVASRYILSSGKKSISVAYNGDRKVPEKSIAPKQEKVVAQKSAPVAESQPVEVKRPSQVRKAEEPKSDKPKMVVTGVVLNVPYFENSVTMSKRSRDDLESQLPAISKAGQVVVRGRPSAPGDESMARSRSLAIKGFLLEHGIDENVIEVMPEDSVKTGKNAGFYLSEILLLDGDATIHRAEKAATAPKVQPSFEFTNEDPTVKTALTRWAKNAGWNISWEASIDFPISVPTKFSPSFEDSVSRVVKSLSQTNNPVRAQFYDGNKVLRIVSMNGDK